MASLVLGSALGYFFGPLGFLAGSALGALLDPQKGPQISDLHLQGSTYGAVIPICYGTMRVAGQVIWTTQLHAHTSKGKGGPEVTTYTASFDVLICEGPISGVQRIWADGTLIYDTTGTVTGLPSIPMTFYNGSESQLPDPTEESAMGAGFNPAYRGYARAVFNELSLTNYGNSIPRLTFQVFTASGIIPWRVSSFAPWSQSSGSANATYANNVITISQPYGGQVYCSQFTPQGVQIGSTVVSSYGGNEATPIVGCNSWVAIDSGNSWHWYTIDPISLIGQDLGYILTGVEPYGTPYQFGGNFPVYCGGYIYTCGATNGGPGGNLLGQWAAPNGVPSNAFTGSYSFSGTTTIKALGTSDTNQLYVYTHDSSGGGSYTLWRFLPGPGFTVDTSWTGTNTTTTNLQYFNSNDFFVTAGANGEVIVFQGQLAGGPLQQYILLVQINGATLVNIGSSTNVSTTGARPQQLQGSTGLGIDPSGVFSVFPPSGGVALSTIVNDISSRCGLASSQYNTLASGMQTIVPGYLISNNSTGRDNIMELRTAYFFDAVERCGVMVFVPRGGPSVISIPDNDLAAQVDHHGQPPPLALVERTQEVDLPATTYVVFIDPNDQYLNGTQYARRLVTNSQTVATVQLAIAMTVQTARATAQLLLFTAWLERNTITILVSRQYAVYEPTDVITAHGYTLRVTDKTYVASNLIQLKGVVTDTPTFVAGPGGAVSGGNPNGPPTTQSQSPTNLIMLNMPLITDTDYAYGPYAALAGASNVLPWNGAVLYESTDGGTTYNQMGNEITPNVIGTVTAAPGNFTGGNIFDKINSITVVIGNGGGTLSSATEAAVLNGDNVAYIGSPSGNGGEIIQFANANLIASNTYVLTDLLRGRRGTEWRMGAHSVGETFVLLSCLDINGPTTDLGQSRLWKAVSGGQAIAAVTAKSFLNSGLTVQCYSPTLLYGSSDASGNVTLNWARRTRIGGQWADLFDVPLSENTESYVVQIWDSTYTKCARVIGGNQSNPTSASAPELIITPTFVYTAAMQTADFGQNEHDIYWSVGQLGFYGLGTQSFTSTRGAGSSNVNPLSPVQPFSIGNPNTNPGGGCVGTIVNNNLNWINGASATVTLSPGQNWQIKLVVSATPVNAAICLLSVLTPSGNTLLPGTISAVLSNVPNCGPPIIPYDNISGQAGVNFPFSIGPSPNPAQVPQLLANGTYYLTVRTTTTQGMKCTLFNSG